MIEDSQMPRVIAAAKAGLNRFLWDGIREWPEETLLPLFFNVYLDHPLIKSTLIDWQTLGCIRIDKKPECYLTVLCEIP